jgi:hypothetical protein
MAAQTKQYDPGQVVVVYGPVIITGFAEDTFITAKRDEQVFTKKIGADGESTRVRNRNKGGQVELTLMASSQANKLLQALLDADELAGAGVQELIIKDLSGESLAVAAQAWICAHPEMGMAKDVGERVWLFDTGELVLKEGGNSDA